MSIVKTYSISGDITAGLCDPTKISSEIIGSSLVVNFDGVCTDGDDLHIIGTSITNETSLDSLILAHDGIADPVPDPLIFGTEKYFISDESVSSTTANVLQHKLILTTGELPAGTYYIQWYAEMLSNWTTKDVVFEVGNGTTNNIYADVNMEIKDTTSWVPISGFIEFTSAGGVETVKMSWKSEGSANVSIGYARLTFWRVS